MKYKTESERAAAHDKRKAYARAYYARYRAEHPDRMEQYQINYMKKKLARIEGNTNQGGDNE